MSSNITHSSSTRGKRAESKISSAMNFASHHKEVGNYAEDEHMERGTKMVGALLGMNRHNLRREPCVRRSFGSRNIDTSSSQEDDRRTIYRLSFSKK